MGKKEVFKFAQGLNAVRRVSQRGQNADVADHWFQQGGPASSTLRWISRMQYSDGYNETILTFANNINNHDGGTHL